MLAVVVRTVTGLRVVWTRNRMMSPEAPTSSAITPMLLILARMATPDMLMIVVRTTITMARMIAFSAKSLLYRLSEFVEDPTNWKRVEI